MIGLLLNLIYLLVFVFIGVWLYLNVLTGAKESKTSSGVLLKYDKPPTVAEFYIRLVFNLGNLTKPGFLPSSKTIPPFEVQVSKADIKERLPQWEKVTGFSRDSKEVPFAFPYATSLSMFAGILSHSKYPIKPLAGIIHMKQSIIQLRPLMKNESIGKRGYFSGGKSSERGTEIEGVTEVYQNNTFESNNLI